MGKRNISSTLSPEQAALRDAVMKLSGHEGLNGEAIYMMTSRFVELVSLRYNRIVDVAMSPENGGKTSFGVRFALDVNRKAPSGKAVISFSSRTTDEADFYVEDPEEQELPFGGSQSQSGVVAATPEQMRGGD
jgi:hypothetical protein